MKKSKKNDSLLDLFRNQKTEINLSKIYGGYIADTIGHKTVKTLLPGGATQNDTTYQPDGEA